MKDILDSPFFFTMPEYLLDYEPEFIEEFPVIEQDNTNERVFFLEGRPFLKEVTKGENNDLH